MYIVVVIVVAAEDISKDIAVHILLVRTMNI